MDPETTQRLASLEEKVEKIYVSVEKTRKYFKWTLIITIAVFVLPLIAAAFVIPSFISSYTSQIQGLSQ